MGVTISYIEKYDDGREKFLLTTVISHYPSYSKGDFIWLHFDKLSFYKILDVHHSAKKLAHTTELGLIVFVKLGGHHNEK